MLRPGLHFSNAIGITGADMDHIKRWSPLSLLEAMGNVDAVRLRSAWELAGRPPVVLRRYYEPKEGGPAAWGAHALDTVHLAELCIGAGIPGRYLILKPFNEMNMPRWANWEGFGDTERDMERANWALNVFMDVAKNELPHVRIGGPHLTVGNRDVKFSNDPPGVYYYHGADMKFESSPCYESFKRFDVHFVHCYGMDPGQYADRAHGLRFLEYEKYLAGKDVYIVEGAYGINCGQPFNQNTVRGAETVAYLRLLEEYPQVKGIALWIGGDRGWDAFRHADTLAADPSAYRPVVFAIEDACKGMDPGEPTEPPEPSGEVVYEGLSPEMIDGLVITAAPQPGDGHWRVSKVAVQPETDSLSAFAMIPVGIGAMVRFMWEDGEKTALPKDDPYAPPGARWNAASMPMFNAWGSYGAEVADTNSERLFGFGLYGAGLEVGYKGHHPVLVWFEWVLPGEEPEPEPVPDYKLVKRLELAPHGFCDLRDEIGSFSDQGVLDKERRDFGSVIRLVVHHSGSDEPHTPLSIAKWHVLQKPGDRDPTIPYHFCIDQDGKLFWTAKLIWTTYHAGVWQVNRESVGVCVLGDFSDRGPSAAQVETLRWLIYALGEFFGGDWGAHRGLYVVPHGDIVGTACPGRLKRALVWQGDWPAGLGGVDEVADGDSVS